MSGPLGVGVWPPSRGAPSRREDPGTASTGTRVGARRRGDPVRTTVVPSSLRLGGTPRDRVGGKPGGFEPLLSVGFSPLDRRQKTER